MSTPSKEASFLIGALENLHIASLSPDVKAEWKRLSDKIAQFVPKREDGMMLIEGNAKEMREVVAEIQEFTAGAESEDEKKLIQVLDPLEIMLIRFAELLEGCNGYRKAFSMFTQKLKAM